MSETRPGLHTGCILPFHRIGCPDYREDGEDWPGDTHYTDDSGRRVRKHDVYGGPHDEPPREG